MSAATDAWQAALAAEHRAVFAYDVLGPRLAGGDRAQAQTFQAAHEALRDRTAVGLAAAGVTPVPTQADYPDVYPTSEATVLATAARVEDGCAAAWRYLYALAPAALRASTQQALTASALRAVQWRSGLDPARASVAFPGV